MAPCLKVSELKDWHEKVSPYVCDVKNIFEKQDIWKPLLAKKCKPLSVPGRTRTQGTKYRLSKIKWHTITSTKQV